MSLYSDIVKFSKKAQEEQEDIIITALFQANDGIIGRTPVDKGRARGSWVPSIGSPSAAIGGKDKSGSSTKRKADSIARKSVGSVYFLTNNLPYIGVLEYGGYPVPVEKGTWVKKSQKYEILSQGGYSKQAPQGMLRVTVKEVSQKLRLNRR